MYTLHVLQNTPSFWKCYVGFTNIFHEMIQEILVPYVVVSIFKHLTKNIFHTKTSVLLEGHMLYLVCIYQARTLCTDVTVTHCLKMMPAPFSSKKLDKKTITFWVFLQHYHVTYTKATGLVTWGQTMLYTIIFSISKLLTSANKRKILLFN